MRATEFIYESVEDVETLKKDIINQVKQEKDNEVLDKAHQVLSHSSIKSKIESAFAKAAGNGNVGNIDSIINDMIDYLRNLQGTTQEKREFVDILEAGKVINTAELFKPASTFDQIFATPLSQRFFTSIAKYGQGKNMKGPGEYALAILSPSISLADKGDLLIDGKHVEVKAAMNKNGGRLGEVVSVSSSQYAEALKTAVASEIVTNDPIPADQKAAEVVEMLYTDNKGKRSASIGLSPMVIRLHNLANAGHLKNAQSVGKVVKAIVELTFGDSSIASAVGRAAMSDSTGKAAQEVYMSQNFEWYKGRDDFDTLLAIAFSSGKTYSISSGEELANLRKQGIVGAPSVSIIPGKPNEVYSQIVFTAK